jgi:hypothetical protein
MHLDIFSKILQHVTTKFYKNVKKYILLTMHINFPSKLSLFLLSLFVQYKRQR